MQRRATGTFEVTLTQLPVEEDAPAGMGRMAIDKRFAGDVDGSSKGVMMTAVSAVAGSAGYVAIERVVASVHGLAGEFLLQHSGTMTRGTGELSVTVVPDSGTGDLEGLAGAMEIEIVEGGHAYTFEYTL